MRTRILFAVAALLIAAPCAAGNGKMCPQLDGKHIKVTGEMRNLMVGGHREPGEAPSTFFDLENPRWNCKLNKVAVSFPGRHLWCSEGQRAEVSGVYHDASDIFDGYYMIDADGVRCR